MTFQEANRDESNKKARRQSQNKSTQKTITLKTRQTKQTQDQTKDVEMVQMMHVIKEQVFDSLIIDLTEKLYNCMNRWFAG